MRGFLFTVAVEDGVDPIELRDSIGDMLIGDPAVRWLHASEPIADLPDEPTSGAVAAVVQACDMTLLDPDPPTGAAALLPFPLAFAGLPIADQRWVGLALLGAFVVALVLVVGVSWWRNRHAPFPPTETRGTTPFKDWTSDDVERLWKDRS